MDSVRVLARLLLGRRLPIISGTITVPAIKHPVTIGRDRWGVPAISAHDDFDAWFGLGFCQGQDRAFQLEFLLRVVRGTLAEMVGRGAMAGDRLSRRIGFLRSAEKHLSVLDADVRTTFDAFAAGVSAGATVGHRRRPHEFALLRVRPTPWRGADILGLVRFRAFAAGSNWPVELARFTILMEDGPKALIDLDPAYPEWLPVTAPPGVKAGPVVDRLSHDIASFSAVVSVGGGSNNWALSASRTATGRPLVANDPHLPPTLPPHWYLAHLKTPSWSVAGASYVGLPHFPVGHNGFGAWGVTIGFVDNTDLFVEEVGPDRRSVRRSTGFVPCEVIREHIKVKGGAPVTEEILITERGPIIGPALDGEVGAVSMRALWLDPLPIRGLFVAHRARSVDEFRQSLAQWPSASLNVVYADRSGTIAWQLMGQAPRRRKGWGLIPLPGWDPETGWEDEPVPFDEMPYLVNPPAAFVATANNQPLPDGTGAFLGADWVDGYRQARIIKELTGRQTWDVESTAMLQMDVRTSVWDEIRSIVLATSARDPATQLALDLLRDWDGTMAVDSAAATVHELFLAGMARRVVTAKARRSAEWAMGQGFSPLTPATLFSGRRTGHLVRLLRTKPEGWFSRPWEEEIADALGTVVRRLEKIYGLDATRWGWGRVRLLTLRHPIGGRKPLDRIFNLGPIPWGGDSTTIGAAGVSPLDPTGNPRVIASLRAVIAVGAWENCRFILPGGQSGNPFSPHYADQLPLWQRGEGIAIPWSDVEVADAVRQTLTLVPDSG